MNLELAKHKLLNTLKENCVAKRKLASTGRLEPSRLAHYKTSKLIFSQPIEWTWREYVANILLDVSWSMAFWERMKGAVRSVQNLIRLFDGVIDFRITCFWTTYYEIGKNRIMSIDLDNMGEWEVVRELDRRVDVVNIKWERHLVPIEWGSYENHAWTWGSWCLEYSRRNLESSSASDKLIILITDWEDYQDQLWRGYVDRASDYCDTVGGVDVKNFNPWKYWDIARRIKEDWITLIPIGIDMWLGHISSEYINISNTDDIYEKTIRFIKESQ